MEPARQQIRVVGFANNNVHEENTCFVTISLLLNSQNLIHRGLFSGGLKSPSFVVLIQQFLTVLEQPNPCLLLLFSFAMR